MKLEHPLIRITLNLWACGPCWIVLDYHTVSGELHVGPYRVFYAGDLFRTATSLDEAQYYANIPHLTGGTRNVRAMEKDSIYNH